jgi:hypothetical protein
MQEIEVKVRKLWDTKKQLTNAIVESYALREKDGFSFSDLMDDFVLVNETFDHRLIELERFLDEKGFYS